MLIFLLLTWFSLQVIAQIWILLLGGLGVAYGLDRWVSDVPCLIPCFTKGPLIPQVAGSWGRCTIEFLLYCDTPCLYFCLPHHALTGSRNVYGSILLRATGLWLIISVGCVEAAVFISTTSKFEISILSSLSIDVGAGRTWFSNNSGDSSWGLVLVIHLFCPTFEGNFPFYFLPAQSRDWSFCVFSGSENIWCKFPVASYNQCTRNVNLITVTLYWARLHRGVDALICWWSAA